MLDYETTSSYAITVTATYAGGQTKTQSLSISVADVNDTSRIVITSASQSVAEGTTQVAELASFVDTKGTNPKSFSITWRANAWLFEIVGGNLVL